MLSRTLGGSEGIQTRLIGRLITGSEQQKNNNNLNNEVLFKTKKFHFYGLLCRFFLKKTLNCELKHSTAFFRVKA